jgi:4-amino-4-deoxy-L-arabinose transferase-like glycosyltransferase
VSRRILATILLAAALYLVGNNRVSLWDRDEPRYAQASRQMLQSGDWVVPQLLDQPRINKPPLIYWCQATAMRFLGDNATAARLPSAIAMTLTLILIAWFVKRQAGEDAAFWTTLVFATSGLVIMAAKMCLTDAVLLLFVTASQFCLYALWRGHRSWPIILTLGTSLGLALLTKGPVAFGINATTLIVLAILNRVSLASSKSLQVETPRRALWLTIAKSLTVLALILAICLPWVIAINNRLPEGLWKTLYHEIFERMTQPLEQHKGPPGYYLLFFLVSFFPWCLFLPTAIRIAWQNRHDPLTRFSLAAVVGPWLMFEAIRTKLPHYVLPCFPFLAILTADAIRRAARNEFGDWIKPRWLIAVAIFCLILIAIGLGPWAAALPAIHFDRPPYAAMATVSAATICFAALIFTAFAQRKILTAARTMAAATFVVMILLFALYLPRARFLHLSEDVGQYLQSIGAAKEGVKIQMIDYKEDSLPFYQGGTIRPQPKNTFLATEPPEKWPRYLTVTREIWDQTPDQAKARLQLLKSFRGWAYADRARIREVLVLRKLPAP